MENIIKKFIDGLKRKAIKIAFSEQQEGVTTSKKNEIRNCIEEKYNYGIWLENILSLNMAESYFPVSKKHLELYGLLSLEISYKQDFKSACDNNHPLAIEILEDLDIESSQVTKYINIVKEINIDLLDYYLLFKDELLERNLSISAIHEKIDELSNDCIHGTIVSHPAKMSNPACKYPRIYASGKYTCDGLLRTGNSSSHFDMHINATKLKVFKFLCLRYCGKTLLDHIKNNNNVFQPLFHVSSELAHKWQESFNQCIIKQDLKTDRLIKQIYFPINNSYHLLSLLQPSGLIFSLKEKIDFLNNHSPNTYLGKKSRKDKTFWDGSYSTLKNLTAIKHGGDHPKNISGLNNKYQTYYLLSSLPPNLEKRETHFPRSDFFIESFQRKKIVPLLKTLQKIIKDNKNNIDIRDARDYCIHEIVNQVIDKMWEVRSVSIKQYYAENSTLSAHQKIWLHESFTQEREDTDDWLDKVIADISRWIVNSYEKIFDKEAIKLGELELSHITQLVEQNKEMLR